MLCSINKQSWILTDAIFQTLTQENKPVTAKTKKLNRLRTKYLKTKCLKTKFNIACAYNPIIEVRMEARFIAV